MALYKCRSIVWHNNAFEQAVVGPTQYGGIIYHVRAKDGYYVQTVEPPTITNPVIEHSRHRTP